MDKHFLENYESLQAISSFCIGTDKINKEVDAENGIAVFNAPYSNSRSVVELTLAEIILLFRKAHIKNAEMQRGHWNKSASGSNEVRGKTLGIIGYGNIGSQLSFLAEGLGMKVIYYDILEKLSIGNARPVDLDYLLKNSDLVSLHIKPI